MVSRIEWTGKCLLLGWCFQDVLAHKTNWLQEGNVLNSKLNICSFALPRISFSNTIIKYWSVTNGQRNKCTGTWTKRCEGWGLDKFKIISFQSKKLSFTEWNNFTLRLFSMKSPFLENEVQPMSFIRTQKTSRSNCNQSFEIETYSFFSRNDPNFHVCTGHHAHSRTNAFLWRKGFFIGDKVPYSI